MLKYEGVEQKTHEGVMGGGEREGTAIKKRRKRKRKNQVIMR